MHLGSLTKPPEISYIDDGVNAGYCHLEIRSAGETDLYLAAACQFDTPHSQAFPLTKEKYAVDLSRSDRVRTIDEKTWQSGQPLLRSGRGGIMPTHPTDQGVSFGGRVFDKSGTKWSGVGGGPVPEIVSPVVDLGLARIAVYSWDGFDIRYDFLDPSALFEKDKVKGQFWIDLYEVASGRRLAQIAGRFDGADPGRFMGNASWYGNRFFVMPIGKTSWPGTYNLRRLLICDIDAAARMSGSALKGGK